MTATARLCRAHEGKHPMDYITEEHFDELKARMLAATDRMEATTDLIAKADGLRRAPSMAAAIAGGWQGPASDAAGRFITALAASRSRDAAEQQAAKATLEGMTRYVSQDDVARVAKATVGSSDATGGWIVPNALVADLVKPAGYENIYRQLLSVQPGISAGTVDVPFRSSRPARAVVAGPGTLKENVDLAYNGYTATMHTLARIYDVGNQFLRHSAGAAERDVLGELNTALDLGEAWYVINGTGSGEPYGLLTALASAPSTFTTSHSPTTSTVAGSVAAAIAKAAGALATRGRRAEAAVISGTALAEMMVDGSDTAGFFLSGISGPQQLRGFAPGTLVSPWGIPVLVDQQFASDDLIVGEWSALAMYLGQERRIDSSDQAGTRWDYNLTGFRGEEEMGLDARPAAYAGAFQYVADVLG